MPVIDTPVLVQNLEPNVTILSSDPKGTYVVEWAAKGDPMANDVQPVPKEMLGLPQFHRAIARGVLAVEDATDPEVKATLERQAEAWAARRAQGQKASTVSLDPEKVNDLLTFKCIGPGSRGDGSICGNDVVVRETVSNDRPPLCNTHSGLAHMFVPDDTEIKDGKTTRKWLVVTTGTREHQ